MYRPALFAAASLVAVAFSGSANAASFNCFAAKTHTEAVICDNPRLSQLDTQMAVSYYSLLNSTRGFQRRRVQAQQIRWLGQRNTCNASISCLFNVYNYRIGQLSGY